MYCELTAIYFLFCRATRLGCISRVRGSETQALRFTDMIPSAELNKYMSTRDGIVDLLPSTSNQTSQQHPVYSLHQVIFHGINILFQVGYLSIYDDCGRYVCKVEIKKGETEVELGGDGKDQSAVCGTSRSRCNLCPKERKNLPNQLRSGGSWTMADMNLLFTKHMEHLCDLVAACAYNTVCFNLLKRSGTSVSDQILQKMMEQQTKVLLGTGPAIDLSRILRTLVRDCDEMELVDYLVRQQLYQESLISLTKDQKDLLLRRGSSVSIRLPQNAAGLLTHAMIERLRVALNRFYLDVTGQPIFFRKGMKGLTNHTYYLLLPRNFVEDTQ